MPLEDKLSNDLVIQSNWLLEAIKPKKDSWRLQNVQETIKLFMNEGILSVKPENYYKAGCNLFKQASLIMGKRDYLRDCYEGLATTCMEYARFLEKLNK